MLQDLVGPMCFAGDYLAKQRMLPRVRDGDIVLVHDTGAVTMAHYNYFNSIPAPPVYAHGGLDAQQDSGANAPGALRLIKRGLTQDDIEAFWE